MSAVRTSRSCQETALNTTAGMARGFPRGFRDAPLSRWQNVSVAKRRGPAPFRDVAAVCGKDGSDLYILRRRSAESPVEAAIVQPLVEGKPLSGEVISLRRREDVPFLFDVTTEISVGPDAPLTSPATGGPAQVATDSYRRGWDAIWGRRPGKSALN